MECTRQCSGCAYKSGAAANSEGDNLLRGVFAALGGYAFVCHESMGWGHGETGYPKGATEALTILTSRHALERAGASAAAIQAQTDDLRRSIRMCGGWKAAVQRLKSSGWYADKRVMLVRRHYAKHAAACIERLVHRDDPARMETWTDKPVDSAIETQDIQESIEWFFNEAKESGIKIGWLFG